MKTTNLSANPAIEFETHYPSYTYPIFENFLQPYPEFVFTVLSNLALYYKSHRSIDENDSIYDSLDLLGWEHAEDIIKNEIVKGMDLKNEAFTKRMLEVYEEESEYDEQLFMGEYNNFVESIICEVVNDLKFVSNEQFKVFYH